MTTSAVATRRGRGARFAPYLLSAPALAVLATLLIVPLVATALLSLHSFSLYKGIQNDYSFANYADIFSDPYFYRIYARTFRIALIVTGLVEPKLSVGGSTAPVGPAVIAAASATLPVNPPAGVTVTMVFAVLVPGGTASAEPVMLNPGGVAVTVTDAEPNAPA